MNLRSADAKLVLRKLQNDPARCFKVQLKTDVFFLGQDGGSRGNPQLVRMACLRAGPYP